MRDHDAGNVPDAEAGFALGVEADPDYFAGAGAPDDEETPMYDRNELAEVLAAHHYRDVLGDYEVAPYYKHFGCSCGWEQNIAGMNGWRSWVAAHDAHLADAVLASPVFARLLDQARADALREAADEWQVGAWTVLTAPIKAESQPQRILGAARAVTDWLRDRANAAQETP